MYTKEQIAQTIDHAILKPFATDKDIVENSKMVDRRLGSVYYKTSICRAF